MRSRPYKLFGAHERAVLAELLEQKVGHWVRDWFPARARLQLECAPARELFADPPLDWLAFGSAGEWCAFAASEAEIDALAAALCGEDPRLGRSALAAEAARSALQDLAALLLERNPQRTEVTPLLGVPGSASFAARVRAGDATLRFVSSPEWTLRALKERLPAPPAARLAGRRQAIASRPVRLRVVAGWAELELGELRGLEVGDVIALDASLERPMRLVLGESQVPVCGARLGVKEGRRAAALTAAR